jgi:DnaJ domain
MSGAFQYKPKFVDIRVRPPKEGEREADVHELKPGERRCDHPGCLSAATARAPKSRDMLDQHYWFCQPHAAEYNKSWNFYAGMSEAQIRAAQENEASTGGRPTWQFKASRFSREAAAFAAGAGRSFSDPFGIFRASQRKAEAQADHERRIGRIERNAFADLDLDVGADKAAIRGRYKELVKRCHPDANGGDRSAEHKLQRVIKAYKTLQKAGLA